MTCIPRHTQTLRSRGYRMTSQHLSILQTLHAGGNFSPAQIFECVQQAGMIDETRMRVFPKMPWFDLLFVRIVLIINISNPKILQGL